MQVYFTLQLHYISDRVDWIVTMLQIVVNMLHRTGECVIIIGKNRHTLHRYVSTCKFGQMIFTGLVVY